MGCTADSSYPAGAGAGTGCKGGVAAGAADGAACGVACGGACGCSNRRNSRPRGGWGCCGFAASAAWRSARLLATSPSTPPTRSMTASAVGSVFMSGGSADLILSAVAGAPACWRASALAPSLAGAAAGVAAGFAASGVVGLESLPAEASGFQAGAGGANGF